MRAICRARGRHACSGCKGTDTVDYKHTVFYHNFQPTIGEFQMNANIFNCMPERQSVQGVCVCVCVIDMFQVFSRSRIQRWSHSCGVNVRIAQRWTTTNYPDQYDNITNTALYRRQPSQEDLFFSSVHSIFRWLSSPSLTLSPRLVHAFHSHCHSH